MFFQYKFSWVTHTKYNVSVCIFYTYPINVTFVQPCCALWNTCNPPEYPFLIFPWLTDLPRLGPINCKLVGY